MLTVVQGYPDTTQSSAGGEEKEKKEEEGGGGGGGWVWGGGGLVEQVVVGLLLLHQVGLQESWTPNLRLHSFNWNNTHFWFDRNRQKDQ